MSTKQRDKIWAPYVEHKTIAMFKENLQELVREGDEESIRVLVKHLKRIFYTFNVNRWVYTWKCEVYAADNDKV